MKILTNTAAITLAIWGGSIQAGMVAHYGIPPSGELSFDGLILYVIAVAVVVLACVDAQQPSPLNIEPH